MTYVFYAQDLKRNDPVNLLAKTLKLYVSEGSVAHLNLVNQLVGTYLMSAERSDNG